MSFASDVKKAFEEAESESFTDPAKEYQAVLDEVATGLRQLGIGAGIKSGADPRRLSLWVSPKHRPSQGNFMLTFFLEGDHIRVFGEHQRIFEDPAALRNYLLQFVRLPAFVESVHILRAEGDSPVEARLRVNRQLPLSELDAMVLVSAEDQARLADAAEGTQVEVVVDRLEFPGNARLLDNYELLDSAGIVIAVDRTEPIVRGSRVRLTGTRMR